ncbi:MAG: BREX-1 system adenine-specific DNA-methyltransferase PglX [Ruminococcus flavefaciens]|nr:BREX-1 system adenine-specific DNA-methyltransferase PglX [Ruminococcus flavefaciens]MCM1231672.1 BREX-1 system adenine-specific DNA-methyltransferase PglX [Ruminococcus flavefaciens]
MNKTAIKNFAVWARKKLIAEITYKAGLLGITENGIAEELPASDIDLKMYDIGTKEPVKIQGKAIFQRSALVTAIMNKAQTLPYKEAFNCIIEEVAYTWFNRLIAIRFMEVNDYLPSGVRVLSSESAGKKEPDMVTTPFETDIDFTDDDIEAMKNLNDDELFRFLFIKQCRKFNDYLPELFDSIEGYMELLLHISFRDEDGVVYHLVNDIPEDDFNVEKEGQVQIIGWLYQYYNSEPKKRVFDDMKKNIKISTENIPAATQLFTPDWIVRYMVENSLGRLWADGHPDFDKSEWKYYLEEAEQEKAVKAQLEEIRAEYGRISPEEIKFLDPCMGSGHILIYAFDVFMQIYLAQGYTERDAAVKIVENNLYGMDIDKRAYQLSYFAVMMKARSYNRRILTRDDKLKPNLCHFSGLNLKTDNLYGKLADFAKQFEYADTYGSLLKVEQSDMTEIIPLIEEFENSISTEGYRDVLRRQLAVYRILSQRYDVVCTNPPYMGGSGMNEKLSEFVKEYFPDSKSDLFACFIEKCGQFAKEKGYYAMITQHAWMFLSSYENLREKLSAKTFINMAHLGARAFDEIGGEVVQTTAFANLNLHKNNYLGTYARLVDIAGENEKREAFLSGENRYTSRQENFSKIPGSPVAYWVSENTQSAFVNGTALKKIAEPKQGMVTRDNKRFMRLWWEISYNNIAFNIFSHKESSKSYKKWYLCTSGGTYRKWYGNLESVVNFERDGKEIIAFSGSHIKNREYYFRESVTWSAISSSKLSMRYVPKGFLPEHAGNCLYCTSNQLSLLQGFSNSVVGLHFLCILSPTLNYNVGDIASLPIINPDNNVFEYIIMIIDKLRDNSKTDWDSFETSWDFEKHPLIRRTGRISEAYAEWEQECEKRFSTLKANEEELNRIFIDIYGLQGELTPEVEDKDVTVRKADLQREIKSLISYAVGCMFGRYSLDTDGLAYAGGEWDDSRYTSFIPSPDNCIPVTDEDYFDNDIVSRFVEFLRIVYGEDTLEENIDFVADALGTKGNTSRQKIRSYFLGDFIKDHNKIYQKRPIYWLFNSGKANGFKVLVYMHRWNADTTGNVRVSYLHRLQRIYEREIERMQDISDNGTGKEVTVAEKRRDKLTKQLKETRDYDAKIAHLALSRIDIDLDDGVKVNYEKVQTGQDGRKLEILTKI